MVYIWRCDHVQLQYKIPQVNVWITFALELTTRFVYLVCAYVGKNAIIVHIFNWTDFRILHWSHHGLLALDGVVTYSHTYPLYLICVLYTTLGRKYDF